MDSWTPKERVMPRHYLSLAERTEDQINRLLHTALTLKRDPAASEYAPDALRDKVLALLFKKPSLRTRASFEMGMRHLGGQAVTFGADEVGMGKREAPEDVARVLSRYVDAVMIRTFGQDEIERFAAASDVPVINGLTDLLHPCQVLADLLTILEIRGTLDQCEVAYVGDGNNVANSLLNAALRLPIRLHLGVPKGYEPDTAVFERACADGRGTVTLCHDPVEAVREAEFVYTDVWASMGQEREADARRPLFSPFQVNLQLLASARPHAKVLHCLPAHRGDEITDEVMDGPQSVVFDQAENRMWAQAAILLDLLVG
jgi:ornithine carbamoyltransferase